MINGILILNPFLSFVFCYYFSPVQFCSYQDTEPGASIGATFEPSKTKTPLPDDSLFSQGFLTDSWIDWAKAKGAKPLTADRLLLLENQSRTLTGLAGISGPLIMERIQPNKPPEILTLPLDLRPDWATEHPLGLFVLSQGFLYRFQTQNQMAPWGLKDCLVKRTDAGTPTLSGSMGWSGNGSLFLFLNGGPANLEGTDGRVVRVPKGQSILTIKPDGQALELFAWGSDGWLEQVVSSSDGNLFFKTTKKDPEGNTRALYRVLAPGEFVKNTVAASPLGQKDRLSSKEAILVIPESQDQSEHLLLIQTENGEISSQSLESDNNQFFPSGNKKPLTRGPGKASLHSRVHGSISVVLSSGANPQKDSAFSHWGSIRPAISETKSGPEPTSREPIEKLGPAPLAKALGNPDSLVSWEAWFEIRKRIHRSVSAPTPNILPVVGELLKIAKEENTLPAHLQKIIPLLELSGDSESIEQIRFLADNASASIRCQALLSLGRLALPQDNQLFQTVLNGFADSDPLVKSAAALALARVAFPGSANALVTAVSFEPDPNSEWTATLRYALRLLGKPAHDRMGQLAQSGNISDLDKSIRYFSESADENAAPVILQLLDYPHLAANQKQLLIGALILKKGQPTGPLFWRQISRMTDLTAETLRMGWEKLETVELTQKPEARDFLIQLLFDSNEDKKWFALAKLKTQAYPQSDEILTKRQKEFPLTIPQKRGLEEAILFQKQNQGRRQ